MSNLQEFSQYIRGRSAVVAGIEKRLGEVQSRYEAFYQEVGSVRDHELGQLAGEISRRRGALPAGLDAALDKARAEADAALEQQLKKLRVKHEQQARKAEEARRKSLELEQALHKTNVDLDAQEEQLKARNEQLLAAIAQYNDRIRSLGGGFGFLRNVFQMRSVQAERERLDQEQADVAARIEALRAQWASRDQEGSKAQEELRAKWTELRTKSAATQAKIDHLVQTRAALVDRSALERVLFERYPARRLDGAPGQPCGRCRAPNPPSNSFCYVCAQRLKADRADLEGSLEEIAEVNHHFRRFGEGMRACQELIGVVRGLGSGLAAFQRSVDSMIGNENQYPLPKLRITVPQECVVYGRNFEVLASSIEQQARHPSEFAVMAAQAAALLTEKHLQGYFERMGQELSRQAGAQWG
jgi:predicted  nucleic acid-binding Zn-ribbon protein